MCGAEIQFAKGATLVALMLSVASVARSASPVFEWYFGGGGRLFFARWQTSETLLTQLTIRISVSAFLYLAAIMLERGLEKRKIDWKLWIANSLDGCDSAYG